MNALRTIADGLIAAAEELPRRSATARHLREAATSLLDADMALERERPVAAEAHHPLRSYP